MMDDWKITRSKDDSIRMSHKNGADFTLEEELVQRIWKHLDLGQQPFESNAWFVQDDEDWGGLDFSKSESLHSGGYFWGITPNALEALTAWRKLNGPSVVSPEPAVTELRHTLSLDFEDLDEEGLTAPEREYFRTLQLLDPEGDLKDVTAAAKKQLKEKNLARVKNNVQTGVSA